MPRMNTIVIAGGGGFIGRHLAEALERQGVRAVILTRSPENHRGPGTPLHWDGRTADPAWVQSLDGAQALVNLAGKNVNCRPTARNRREILDSRVESTRALGQALRQIARPPSIWVQASSLAIYGNAGDRLCDEAARVDPGYPANVCTAWEAALGEALLPGTRAAVLRMGFVLDAECGALPLLARLTRCGLGGSIGNGRQWISWLHRDDLVAMILRAINDPDFPVICNATGPHPVTNSEFMRALRETLRRPWSPPAPAFAVHLGACALGSDPAIALTGRRCVPAALDALGFTCRHPNLVPALHQLLHP